MNSHNFNEFTVFYNGYGKKQFLYLGVWLGSSSFIKCFIYFEALVTTAVLHKVLKNTKNN